MTMQGVMRLRATVDWRLAVVVAAAVVLAIGNLPLAWNQVEVTLHQEPFDWRIFVTAAERAWAGVSPYAERSSEYVYNWSPVAAYGLVVLDWIGPEAWRLAHLILPLALPTWPLRVGVLLSWPLWSDLNNGNIMVVVMLAAVWALRDNRVAGWAFLALTLLVPRPIMFPVAAWLLWREPSYRLGFAVLFAVHALAVLATGWGDDWLRSLVAESGQVSGDLNVGPTRWLGMWWYVAGLPLAAWLWWKGWVGAAALAVSPYLLSHWLLLLPAREASLSSP